MKSANPLSLTDFFDTTIRVHRRTVTRGALREEVVSYVPGPMPAGPNAAVNRPTAPLGDKGPGLAPIGERRVYMAPGADVQARDILELIAGPDAPQNLEVDEPPTRPGNDHTQIRGRLWEGTLA